jgi:hypothetical protein
MSARIRAQTRAASGRIFVESVQKLFGLTGRPIAMPERATPPA